MSSGWSLAATPETMRRDGWPQSAGIGGKISVSTGSEGRLTEETRGIGFAVTVGCA